MHNAVPVAVVQRTPNLPRELACHSFSQPPVADDVVQHLSPVDILGHHVIVVLVNDHLPHPADVRVMEQHRQRSLAQDTDLLRRFLRSLLRRRLRVSRRLDAAAARSDARKDFDSELDDGQRRRHTPHTSSAHLFPCHVVMRELHFAHAPRTQRLAQRVIAEDPARAPCPAAAARCRALGPALFSLCTRAMSGRILWLLLFAFAVRRSVRLGRHRYRSGPVGGRRSAGHCARGRHRCRRWCRHQALSRCSVCLRGLVVVTGNCLDRRRMGFLRDWEVELVAWNHAPVGRGDGTNFRDWVERV